MKEVAQLGVDLLDALGVQLGCGCPSMVVSEGVSVGGHQKGGEMVDRYDSVLVDCGLRHGAAVGGHILELLEDWLGVEVDLSLAKGVDS